VRRQAAEKAAAGDEGPATGGPRPERSPLRRPDRQAERQRAKARREVEALEEEVVRLEERVREIDAALADPAVWKDGPRTRELTLARDDARRAVDTRYAAWEEAVRKLEEVPA
jgi:chromosome segregation ATPase